MSKHYLKYKKQSMMLTGHLAKMNRFQICRLCGDVVENFEDGKMHPGCRKSLNSDRYLEDVINRKRVNQEAGEGSSTPSFTELSGGDLFSSQVSY